MLKRFIIIQKDKRFVSMIEIREIEESDLEVIHKIGYSEDNPYWASMNAPYFDEYERVDFDTFKSKEGKFFLRDEGVAGIYLDGNIIGMVSSYWESKVTRWLELGIIIYQEKHLRKGYGSIAMKQWIQECFDRYPEIQRVGMTTWSGNQGLMSMAIGIGMTLEACIRQVRYYNGVYYDSIKYGILRSEWLKKM